MQNIKPLPAKSLYAFLDAKKLGIKSSEDIINKEKITFFPFQPRVLEAFELALKIKNNGYNIFFCGENRLGKSYLLNSYLKHKAASLPVPPDLVYVRNFSDPDSPLLLKIKAGKAAQFRDRLLNLILEIESRFSAIIYSSEFIVKRENIFNKLLGENNEIFTRLEKNAKKFGMSFNLNNDGSLNLDDLLNKSCNSGKKHTKNHAVQKLAEDFINARILMDEMEENERHKIMTALLEEIFPNFEKDILKIAFSENIKEYLELLRKDIINECDLFIREAEEKDAEDLFADILPLQRYNVAVFIDNGSKKGAPVIFEDNPSVSNLFGYTAEVSDREKLSKDFRQIRPGSVQRANGGFLVIHADDILRYPQSFEVLLLSLRTGYAKVDERSDCSDSPAKTQILRPQPLNLDIKVIIIGTDETYEMLLNKEQAFEKLFCIKAHMTSETERNAGSIKTYLCQLAKIIEENRLLPFTADALAWLVNLGSYICDDQHCLSLKFPVLREYMIEANELAKNKKKIIADESDLEDAFSAKNYRANLLEEKFLKEYDSQIIKVKTTGAQVGQVNGLSLSWDGSYEFGLPHSISCAIGVGHDGIIDLEREADLGGPIHTKAILILKSYLTNMFAQNKPLVLSASLYFEQIYAEIEGDSASGAELAAIISALSNVPVRLDLAFTGAVNHNGQILAVGGVSRKIEGFYNVCARKGLTGTQGVIIPFDNAHHLMLSRNVIESANKNQFAIYAVKTLEEALFLLTGINPGKRLKNGDFTKNSIFDLANRKLEQLGYCAQNAFKKQRS